MTGGQQGHQGWDRAPEPLPPAPAAAPQQPVRPRVGRILLVAAALFVVVVVAVPLVVTRLVSAAQDPGDGSDVLALSQDVLEAVRDRDDDAVAAVLADENAVLRPNGSYDRQPRPSDLLVGDRRAAEAIDLEIAWTEPELDRSTDDEPLTNVSAWVATTVTYGFTVAGERSEASYRVRLVWLRDGGRDDWALHHVVTPDLDEFESTYAPAAFEGTEQDPAAGPMGIEDCEPNWIAITQGFDVHDQPGSPECVPDGAAIDPALQQVLSRPASEREIGFESVQTQLTLVDWSEDLPLSQWLVEVDDREYVVVVVGARDGTGRVAAAVPTT